MYLYNVEYLYNVDADSMTENILPLEKNVIKR